ncbi:hypothetical protein [Asticcacaulis solisilvae]|uniref:hypothetical protein n=1 Tax=Asticcacaulis solisilvae TaxID=1217274 RepID=UPI003FD816DE
MTPIVLRRRVTTRDRLTWLAGAGLLAMMFCGVFAIGQIGDPTLMGIMGSLCPACGFIALIVLWHAAFHPDLQWTIDEDTIAVWRGTVFGKRTLSWPMAEVVRVRIRRIEKDEWAETYRVELKLASGKRLKLPAYKRQGRSDEIAEQIETWRARA